MAGDDIEVEVVYAAAPHRLICRALRLPAGTTVADALRASGLVDELSEQELAPLKAGVWGRVVPEQTPLRHGDRIELTRPLTVDPKEARRLRYRRDGLKSKRRARRQRRPPQRKSVSGSRWR